MLQKRGVADWGNFSWFSIRMVLSSINDRITKQLDSTIVNRRRMRWVAMQRDRGIDLEQPVRLKQSGVLVVGDPGEMDASQYVLLRELLAAHPDGKPDDPYEVLLLMSDIVYPAGDINAWRDAVYRPYFGLPRWEWDAAVAEWRERSGRNTSDLSPPHWHVFATPGNHDWYDGLTGFMWHACGASILPVVEYSNENSTSRQRLSRALWRSPGRPNSSEIHPLRERVAERWSGKRGAIDAETPRGPMPFQPGPYYSIDLGAQGSTQVAAAASDALVRLVCVDNGIDGSIDVDQANWLERQLAEPPSLPKVVVFGKPLVVDNKVSRLPIEGGRWRSPTADKDPEEDRKEGLKGDWTDARTIINGGPGIVATMAGDIHNAQRFVIGGKPIDDGEQSGAENVLEITHRPLIAKSETDPALKPEHRWSIDDALQPDRLPPLHIVAGGGGAYLTETHKIEIEGDGKVKLEDELVEGASHTVPRGGFRSYPSREASILLFASNVRRWSVAAFLGGVGVLLLAAAWALATTANGTVGDAATVQTPDLGLGESAEVDTWRALLGSIGMAGLLAVAIFSYLRPEGTGWRPRLLDITLGALFLGVVVPGWWVEVTGLPILIGGTAAALLLPFVLLAPPLIRTFPSLRRLIPTRLLLLGLAVGLTALLHSEATFWDRALWALALTVGVVGLFLLLRRGVQLARDASEDHFAATGRNHLIRAIPLIAAFVPALALIAGFMFMDGLDNERWVVTQLIQLIGVTELFVAVLAVALFVAQALLRARFSAPKKAILIPIAGLLGALASMQWDLDWDLPPDGGWATVDGFAKLDVVQGGLALVSFIAVTLIVSSVVFACLADTPDDGEVSEALRKRDLKTRESRGEPSMALFRAMAISGLPMLGQLAESNKPPFYKSFLTLDAEQQSGQTQLTFSIFGLRDEREPRASGHPASPTEPADRGSYLVDSVVVSLKASGTDDAAKDAEAAASHDGDLEAAQEQSPTPALSA